MPAGWTLRRRVRVVFASAAAVAVVLLASGAYAFLGLLDARTMVLERHGPALLATDQYYAAMLAQQNAVRGVLLTGSPEFLEAFDQAQVRSDEAADRIRAVLDAPRLRAELDEILTRMDRWQADFAAAELAAREAGEEVPPAVVEASREVFEQLDVDVVALQGQIRVLRDDAEGELDQATRVLVLVLATSLVALVAIAVGIGAVLRRWVTGPLEQLGAEAEEVRTGRLSRPIRTTGPPEVQQLGAAVEAMRARIQRDLAEVEEARLRILDASEELARSNRDLEQFAYVASHDLQEPLRKVISFCQLLQDRYEGHLDERADQYIAFAVDGAKRMQQLINDLLAFSRVGRVPGLFEPVDLGECLERATDNLSELIAETGASIERGALPVVLGERHLLVAVLQNLVGNALKFRRPGVPPVVRLDARKGAEAWEISVADNGIGIEPAYAERVFVIFQRLHPKDVYAGTGIGLALCRRIIEHHGGQIRIDPDAPEGTIVRFTLPTSQERRAAPVPEPRSEEKATDEPAR